MRETEGEGRRNGRGGEQRGGVEEERRGGKGRRGGELEGTGERRDKRWEEGGEELSQRKRGEEEIGEAGTEENKAQNRAWQSKPRKAQLTTRTNPPPTPKRNKLPRHPRAPSASRRPPILPPPHPLPRTPPRSSAHRSGRNTAASAPHSSGLRCRA